MELETSEKLLTVRLAETIKPFKSQSETTQPGQIIMTYSESG